MNKSFQCESMEIMTRFVSALILLCTVSMCSSPGRALSPVTESCRTKYPIVLVHGLGFRDDLAAVRYWGKIVDYLRRHGAVVILGRQQAFASHEVNGKLIRDTILTFLKNNPQYQKVNIIAHSKGGIESRYMIGRLGMEERVASLTTIATPHRGSPIADMVMNQIPSDRNAVITLVNGIARLVGDPLPDAYDAGRELTTEFMKKFNRDIPDSTVVAYQSYACVIDRNYPNFAWVRLWEKIHEKEGPNDGLVSVRSAQWGQYRGLVTHEGKNLVSHADVIGMHQITGVFGFNEEKFFETIASDLVKRGF